MDLTEVEVAWLAGLLEGEGSFTMSPRPRIQLQMVDRDTVAKAARLLNASLTEVRATVTGKPVYQTNLGRKPDLLTLLPRLLPYMGERRSERIQELLGYLTGGDHR